MTAVLSSFPDPRPTTNPYIVQLARALSRTEGITFSTFSWRTALTRRVDVFHAHWPEILVGGRTGPKKLARQALFAAMVLRFRLQGTAIVRTVHNLHLPEGISPVERALLTWFDRWTTHRVILNESTRLPEDQPRSLVLHGHYRDWFAGLPRRETVPGRLAFVGMIRRYKGTETLVEAFRELTDPGLSLSVSGKPSNEELAADLHEVAGEDPRVRFRFAFVDDAELVTAVTEAELVVLPYRHMHNSGGVLTALSLDRPVLVPDNEVNRRLAEEVGPGWVHLFEGELDAAALRRALDAVRADGPARRRARPDLSRREWAAAGSEHAAAYRRALATAPRGGAAVRRDATTGRQKATTGRQEATDDGLAAALCDEADTTVTLRQPTAPGGPR
ncbi:glycosyltransferase [Kocuria sp. M1N1S27]|uniref:glycosyltransferase n=1 Tax=Kocuria kalidii TaxID=3376283 RepID=UPI003794B083